MKTLSKSSFVAIASIAMLTACTEEVTHTVSSKIIIDQCGYLPASPKMALFNGKAHNFKLLKENGDAVYEGIAAAACYYAEADESYRRLDFSSVTMPGEYTLVVDDSIYSMPITIGANVYDEVAKSAARAFYYNRASMAIDEAHGGKWARKAGHPDTNVMVHKSAASVARPEGTIISSPGGWYDAGDYNKYIVNSGISTYTMLLTNTVYNKKVVQTTLNIPETGNSIPDLLNETLYNLRWMLTMQDPNDGGVYHKLTTLSFEAFIMPEECNHQRYVVAKGTAAALDFAATMAYAARHLGAYDQNGEMKALADSCHKASVRAFAWAMNNPNVLFRNPDGVTTGEYGDWKLKDEFFWAATEMWLTTGEERYAEIARKNMAPLTVPSWGNVAALGYYSMAMEGKEIEGTEAKMNLINMADTLLTYSELSPIALSIQRYEWGSNSEVANTGMIKLLAHKLTGEIKYYNSALDDLHYLLGRNCVGRCFVTGCGQLPPMNIHHRQSGSDNIEDPVPGFMCGGPNNMVPTDCDDSENVVRSHFPAKAYSDVTCSYSTNEIAINWNAPLVFLTWGIESY